MRRESLCIDGFRVLAKVFLGLFPHVSEYLIPANATRDLVLQP
jgi:hypothetical protein